MKPLTEGGGDKKAGAAPKVFMIGGAFAAGELDAKRAIDQGTRLAAVVESAKSGEVFDAPNTKGLIMNTFDLVKGIMGK